MQIKINIYSFDLFNQTNLKSMMWMNHKYLCLKENYILEKRRQEKKNKNK